MAVRVNSLTFLGIKVLKIDVQIHLTNGLPGFTIVGLADKTIAESKERVKAAFSSIGLSLPSKRITINLAPADLVKEGSHFDLAIAVALLVSMNVLDEQELDNYYILGELALDGAIVSVAGVLPAAIHAKADNRGIICPHDNSQEAAWSNNDQILAADNLIALINHFKGSQIIASPTIDRFEQKADFLDLYDVKAQLIAKRALLIAASGGHNLLMSGPPGAGKSMLAKRLASILPPMSAKEILDCSIIRSIAGKLNEQGLHYFRPFRAPHHSCSVAAMVGGGIGKKIAPGEVSLAHNGILFLDELPEFSRIVIDSLRQPLENKQILISRAAHQVDFPANFQLVAAMNPCRCGYLGDLERSCNRAPRCAIDYQAKISGPIFDRIDLHVEVEGLKITDFNINSPQISSKELANQVQEARNIQLHRYQSYNIKSNNELDGKLLTDFTELDIIGQELMMQAVDKFKLSMRSYNRILKVARTIADLAGSKLITKIHLVEAISYRQILIRK